MADAMTDPSDGGNAKGRKGKESSGKGSGCGVVVELLVLFALFVTGVITWSMLSNTGAMTNINGEGAGGTAVDFMHERIISSSVIALAGAVVGGIVGFLVSGASYVRKTRHSARGGRGGKDEDGITVGMVACIIVCILIGAGYGLVGTVTNVRSLAAGPVMAQVGRPMVSTKAQSDDDSSWYECSLTFRVAEGVDYGREMTFDVGSCVNGKHPNPDARMVHDLQTVAGDKLVLEYYDAFIWPVYAGLKTDPAYS